MTVANLHRDTRQRTRSEPGPFPRFFTQRLPQPLRTQLGEEEPGDQRALAAKADKLWAVHAPTVSALTAVSSLEAAEASCGACATIRGGGKATAVEAASSAAEEVPRVPRLRLRPVPLPPRKILLHLLSPGSPVVSASSTGTSLTGLPNAHRPAAGETSQPGAA